MDISDLNERLLEDARRCEPASQRQSRLAPHRAALVLYRAKHMSYERIAGALLRHGLRVAAPTIGTYCRRNIAQAEILRERRRFETESRHVAGDRPGGTPPRVATKPMSSATGRRGPRIARDDF